MVFKPAKVMLVIIVLRSDLRASLNGRDLPEEDKARMLNMHEKIVRLEEEQQTTKEQLLKARAVRYQSNGSSAL